MKYLQIRLNGVGPAGTRALLTAAAPHALCALLLPGGPGYAPLDRQDGERFVQLGLVPIGHRGVVVAALVGVAMLNGDPY